MNWILVDWQGRLMALGSWQGIVEAGEEHGCIKRRWSEYDGRETAPELRSGFMVAPAAMFPEIAAEFDQ